MTSDQGGSNFPQPVQVPTPPPAPTDAPVATRKRKWKLRAAGVVVVVLAVAGAWVGFHVSALRAKYVAQQLAVATTDEDRARCADELIRYGEPGVRRLIACLSTGGGTGPHPPRGRQAHGTGTFNSLPDGDLPCGHHLRIDTGRFCRLERGRQTRRAAPGADDPAEPHGQPPTRSGAARDRDRRAGNGRTRHVARGGPTRDPPGTATPVGVGPVPRPPEPEYVQGRSVRGRQRPTGRYSSDEDLFRYLHDAGRRRAARCAATLSSAGIARTPRSRWAGASHTPTRTSA